MFISDENKDKMELIGDNAIGFLSRGALWLWVKSLVTIIVIYFNKFSYNSVQEFQDIHYNN